MKLNNNTIYLYASNLMKALSDLNIYIPARANFFIQKNTAILSAAAQEVEEARLKIAQHYGTLNENGTSFNIPPEAQEQVNKELTDLLSIEQDLDIKTFKIEDLGNAEFTASQMKAIMFMIEE